MFLSAGRECLQHWNHILQREGEVEAAREAGRKSFESTTNSFTPKWSVATPDPKKMKELYANLGGGEDGRPLDPVKLREFVKQLHPSDPWRSFACSSTAPRAITVRPRTVRRTAVVRQHEPVMMARPWSGSVFQWRSSWALQGGEDGGGPITYSEPRAGSRLAWRRRHRRPVGRSAARVHGIRLMSVGGHLDLKPKTHLAGFSAVWRK